MKSTALPLLLASTCVLFWLWIGIKGIISRKIKIPYLLVLYLCISIIFAVTKSLSIDTETNFLSTLVVVLVVFTLITIFRFWKSNKFWETIDDSFSENAVEIASESSFRGSGVLRLLIKIFGKKVVGFINISFALLLLTAFNIYTVFYMV